MNPNSAHQTWSKWIITVRPGHRFVPSFETTVTNTSRFLRKAFGSTGQFQIKRYFAAWVITVFVEGDTHPDDPAAFTYFSRALTEFFRNGFGPSTQVQVKARLMAGARLDGRPADQLLIVPGAQLLH